MEPKRQIEPALPDIFPPLCGPTESAGMPRREVAKFHALAKQTLVAHRSGDNMLNTVGVADVDAGDAVIPRRNIRNCACFAH
jgi:sugar (pentulose or hexulose) kinase